MESCMRSCVVKRMEQRPIYHAKCQTCGLEVSNHSDLPDLETWAEEHVKLAPSHEVLVWMDLMDVEIRLVRSTARDLGEVEEDRPGIDAGAMEPI